MRKKTWGKKITPAVVDHVRAYVHGKIGIQEFMNRTKTNNSSCYSTIARTLRDVHKNNRPIHI